MRVPIKNNKPESVIRIDIVLHRNRRMFGADLVDAIILRPLGLECLLVRLLQLLSADEG